MKKNKSIFSHGIAFACILVMLIAAFLVVLDFSFNQKNEVAEAGTVNTTLVNEKVYILRNAFSDYYLEVLNGSSGGTLIHQYHFNFSDAQRFKVLRIAGEDNLYELIPWVSQSKRVNIEGGQGGNGANVQIYQSNSTNAQRFKIEHIGNGKFKILTKASNYTRCIASRGDAQYDLRVHQWDYYGHDCSHWIFEDAYGEEVGNPTAINDKVYFIRNQKSNMYMDCKNGSYDNGTIIQQHPFNGTAAQMFRVAKISGTTDQYKLNPYINNGTSVDVAAGSSQNGAKIQVWHTYQTDNQVLKIQSTGNEGNSYKILTKVSNYTKCLSTLRDAFLNNVVQWDYSNDGNSDNDHWIFEEAYVQYIETASVTAGQSEPPEFTFILPDARYYTLEFKSLNPSVDTYFTVSGKSGNIDKAGAGQTDSVYFKSAPGQRVTVRLFVKSGSSVPTVFTVRKFQSIMYGFSYDGVNTTGYIDSPSNNMQNEAVAVKCKNYVASHIMEVNERGLQRINSEIVYITGHGDNEGVQFAYDSQGNETKLTFTDIINADLSRVKLILFGSCQSGAGSNNLVTAAVVSGAQAAIGFKYQVGDDYVRQFGEWFFYFIREHTVKKAIEETIKKFGDNPIREVFYRIVDENNFRVFPAGYTIKSLSLNYKMVEQFELEKENYKDVIQLYGNTYRYHKTINGIRTDDFYDIEYDVNGEIIEISRSKNIIGNKDILPIRITKGQEPAPTLFNSVYVFEESIKYICYRDINGVMVPIEIDYNNYYNIETGYGYQQTICTNLYDGSNIDPMKIMFVK